MRTATVAALIAGVILLPGCPAGEPTVVEGDGARVEIPPGALDEDVEIGVEATDAPLPLPMGYTPAGEVFAFTPHGQTFAEPVTIELPYDDGVAGELVVLRLDDEADTSWEEVAGVSFAGGTATFETTSFSFYVPAADQGGGDDDSGDDDSGDDDSGPVDGDGDGFPEGEDCDDGDAAVYPGADEPCDGVDSDCNGTVDDGCVVNGFVQAGNHEVDLLLIVDNTCSMTEEQSELAQSLPGLVAALAVAGIDYQIGVVTVLSPELVGQTPVVTPATPDPTGTLVGNALVGTDGSGDEQGLEMGWQALQLAQAGTPPNAGFLRERAGLDVLAISDEDDVSPSPVADYQAWLEGIALRPEHVQFHTICGNDGSDATDCIGQAGGASAGTRYVTLAQDTGGVLGSICDADWDTTLDAMVAQADHLADTFVLSQAADPTTLHVTVDGAPTTGWSHDASLGAVVFVPAAVPDNGAAVEVRYRP